MTACLPLAEILRDAKLFTDGDWVESKDQDVNGDVRLTQLADVGDGEWLNRSNRHMTSTKAVALKCTFLEAGDLLVARMPDPLGRCCVFPGESMPCVTVVDVCVIRPDTKKICPRYLMHAINAPSTRAAMENFIVGTTRPRISRKNIGKVTVTLPALAEQRQIASMLDSAARLRTKRRESIEELDSLVQATFIEMFGHPAMNPKGWAVRPLGEVVSNEDSRRVPVKKADREKMQGRYPYYGASGVIDHVDDYLFEGERLLIGEDGANLLVRSSPIAFRAHGRYWVNNHAHVLANNGEASLAFLETLINLLDLTQYVSGSAQPKLTQASLNGIPIPVAPTAFQARFAGVVQSTKQQKARLLAHLAELDALFTSLQSRAFHGGRPA
jgi:type I restriction enzyme S subunit